MWSEGHHLIKPFSSDSSMETLKKQPKEHQQAPPPDLHTSSKKTVEVWSLGHHRIRPFFIIFFDGQAQETAQASAKECSGRYLKGMIKQDLFHLLLQWKCSRNTPQKSLRRGWVFNFMGIYHDHFPSCQSSFFLFCFLVFKYRILFWKCGNFLLVCPVSIFLGFLLCVVFWE